MAANVVFKIQGGFEVLDSEDPNVWIVNSDGKEIGQIRRQGRAIFVLVDPARYQELKPEEQIRFGKFVEHIRE